MRTNGWKTVRWREGTKGWLESRFLAVRVQPSHGFVDGEPPHKEVWLLVEWPEEEKEPTKYFLCDLPASYTLRRLVRLWLSMFLNFSVMPLRLATLFGLGFGALGALAAVIVIVEAIISDKPPQGWASLMVAVLVLAGVQLVVVGLIGEYLGRMFLAVNRKPQYLVRDVFRRGSAGLEVERPKVDTRAAGQPHREPSQGES